MGGKIAKKDQFTAVWNRNSENLLKTNFFFKSYKIYWSIFIILIKEYERTDKVNSNKLKITIKWSRFSCLMSMVTVFSYPKFIA